MKRTIIHIDEEKCNGCGACAAACHEGATSMVGEVLNTYIICEEEGGTVYLVDKHAAHERLRFDALKAHALPVMPQVLLTPLTVELDQDAYTALLEQMPLLREFGFACEDFGGGTLLVREIPDYVDAANVPATLEELSEQFLSDGVKAESARDSLLHTMQKKEAEKPRLTRGKRKTKREHRQAPLNGALFIK